MAETVCKGRQTWNDRSVMRYSVTDDGVLTISGSLSARGKVHINAPVKIRSIVISEGVTSIGNENFEKMEELEELTFPSTLKSIGAEAFDGCEKLMRINFSEGLESIGYRAFACCSSLSEVRIPNSVKIVGARSFRGCKALTDVSLPDGISTVEDEAFEGCMSLVRINFPGSIQDIGKEAFDGCDKLKDVILENKDIHLGLYAFGKDEHCTITGEDGNEYDCYITNFKTNINTVEITSADGGISKGEMKVPGSFEYEGRRFTVSAIMESAFSGSSIPTSLTIPDTITEIHDYAFSGCRNLSSVKLGKNVRSIGDSAFENCRELKEIDLGESLDYIGMDCFSGCRRLNSLSLPETLTVLGCRALEGTGVFSSERDMVYLGHVLCGCSGRLPEHCCLDVKDGTTVIAERAFSGHRNIERVIFADTVKWIGYCAFDECDDLQYVKLPASLVKIGEDAFGYTDLKDVIAPWPEPVKLDHKAFPKTAVIHIPAGTREAYEKAQYWKDYKLVED